MSGAARRILLDENMPHAACRMPHAVADALVAAGHDVQSVAALAAGINDRAVLDLARGGNRWLLTFGADFGADFGELAFQKGKAPPPAIVFFRLNPMVLGDLLALALRAIGDDAVAGFTVVTREGTRRRPFTRQERWAWIETSVRPEGCRPCRLSPARNGERG